MFICDIAPSTAFTFNSHFQNSLSTLSIERVYRIPLWDFYQGDFQRALKIIIVLYSHWIGLSPCQHVKVRRVRRSFRCLARKADFPEEPPLREEGGTIPKISLLLVVFSGRLKTSSAWHYIWLHPFRGMALDPGDQLRVE